MGKTTPKVVLSFFSPAESKSGLYFVPCLFFLEVLAFFVRTNDSICRQVFGQNQAVRFARITPLSQTIKNLINFLPIILEKRLGKRINNGFGTQIEIEIIQLF